MKEANRTTDLLISVWSPYKIAKMVFLIYCAKLLEYDTANKILLSLRASMKAATGLNMKHESSSPMAKEGFIWT
jgi:hypothetical protein